MVRHDYNNQKLQNNVGNFRKPQILYIFYFDPVVHSIEFGLLWRLQFVRKL